MIITSMPISIYLYLKCIKKKYFYYNISPFPYVLI